MVTEQQKKNSDEYLESLSLDPEQHELLFAKERVMTQVKGVLYGYDNGLSVIITKFIENDQVFKIDHAFLNESIDKAEFLIGWSTKPKIMSKPDKDIFIKEYNSEDGGVGTELADVLAKLINKILAEFVKVDEKRHLLAAALVDAGLYRINCTACFTNFSAIHFTIITDEQGMAEGGNIRFINNEAEEISKDDFILQWRSTPASVGSVEDKKHETKVYEEKISKSLLNMKLNNN